MNLKQWCELDELIYAAETDEQYRQYAGFDHSKMLIKRLAKMRLYNSQIFIDNFTAPRKLVIRSNFMELFFVVFYTANSLMKLEYWKQDLSIDEASELYSKLIKEYVGFEVPGEYWLLHHILPEDIVYVPSYLLAAVRAKELDIHMQNRFGDKWWTVKEAGRELRDIMKPGAKIDLSLFSGLNSTYFMNEIITGHS